MLVAMTVAGIWIAISKLSGHASRALTTVTHVLGHRVLSALDRDVHVMGVGNKSGNAARSSLYLHNE